MNYEEEKKRLKMELSDILVRAAIMPMAHEYEVVKEMHEMLENELDNLNSAYEQ